MFLIFCDYPPYLFSFFYLTKYLLYFNVLAKQKFFPSINKNRLKISYFNYKSLSFLKMAKIPPIPTVASIKTGQYF